MKTPNILARLLGRGSASPVASMLYSSVIGQPLLVHPQMGERLIGGYLHGAVEARPPTVIVNEIAPQAKADDGVVTAARNVAVLNISGGLANRYDGDLCDPGPLSYQELRSAFDRVMADDNVEAVVLRIESPGGMAAGCFDLADHIYANRGTKPIYAAVDDYAYSAAFAIACAADQVWLTRTGGVGSVGVIAYHYDQSAFDARVGVKVTAVYSGSHKNDMSPHAPLDEGTQSWLQERMDSMRTLFATSVATYRSMKVEDVLATEAMVYQGQAGIDVGFADKLGTFTDLLAFIRDGAADDGAADGAGSDEPPPADAPEAAAAVVAGAAAEQAELQLAVVHSVADAVAAADAAGGAAAALTAGELAAAFSIAIAASSLPPALSLALIARGHFGQTPEAAIAYASTLRDLAFAAGCEDLAIDFVKANTPIETARAQLIELKSQDGPEIVTSLPHRTTDARPASSTDIYSRRRAAAAGTGASLRQ